ncbi:MULTISPECIES: hypothetical protein [Peptacetobacter]|jgi:hypothetical protein|uniref:hypothetical protein n=1 Tax=Peptacetobacter TaxID=2743582 RepID=UPI002E76072A|nr:MULTISPECIES: hypothetical protein [Peptacetobacter]MEE0247405.1 hypothetical protein [Peptacetobacter hiranonis]MEE0451933.1 hypothetical protein [Peptacetobacter sp.]
MNETELVTKSAEKLHKRFPYMKLSEAIKTSWEIVKSNRMENGEADVDSIDKTVKDICGEQN